MLRFLWCTFSGENFGNHNIHLAEYLLYNYTLWQHGLNWVHWQRLTGFYRITYVISRHYTSLFPHHKIYILIRIWYTILVLLWKYCGILHTLNAFIKHLNGLEMLGAFVLVEILIRTFTCVFMYSVPHLHLFIYFFMKIFPSF